MRRIVAILLIILVAFLVVYGLFDPFTNIINDFALNVVGPAGFATLSGVYLAVVATIGILGLWATGIIIGVVFGIVIYSFWHKADWRLRRWGANRTATDLGTQPVSQFPATPPGATTRPETTKEVVAKVEAVAPKEPVKEE